MELVGAIGVIVSLVAIIAFFFMAVNISEMNKSLKEILRHLKGEAEEEKPKTLTETRNELKHKP